MIRSPLHAACAAGLVFAFACAAAGAQELASNYDGRVVDDGMTLIADGLYAQTIGTTQSYVAVSPAGHQALLEKLRELRRMSAKGGSAGSAGPLDELTALLSAPVPKNQDIYGDCTGIHPGATGPFEARALAGGSSPYGASGLAANSSSPTVATTNRVYVTVYDADGIVVGQQETITYGNTLAVASAYAPQGRGCTADSLSTVTCPGATRPAITAIAHNQRAGCVIH